MDSVFIIKRACYRRSEFKPGSLFAYSVTSPFIRVYLGTNARGYHLTRVIRSFNRDVHFSVEAVPNIYFAHKIVPRKRSNPYVF